MFIECSLIGNELHSHSQYANTHLFKNFIAKFIADSPQTESKQKDDFVEEWGYNGLMKKLLAIIVLGLLLNTNAQAKHRTFDDPFLYYKKFEVKGSENHYKFQSSLREDKDVLKEIKNTKRTGLISYLLFEDDKIVID